MCFQFDSGSLPPADRSTSHLFSKRVLKATSFIEKSLFHFHTDPPRGGSDICRKQSQTMYSLLPPSPLPCMTPPGRGFNPPTHFPPRRLEHMIWWVLSIIRFRSILRARGDLASPVGFAAPRLPVMIKCPLQLEMPQIKGYNEHKLDALISFVDLKGVSAACIISFFDRD